MQSDRDAVRQDQRASILVLCTENACRSQITAAYLKKHAGNQLRVFSAGTRPAEDIHPLTRVVLAEDGLDLGDRIPTNHRHYLGRLSPYYLIIVCSALAQACPAVWPGVIERLVWPFDDPAETDGTYEEKLAKFRQVRDQIKTKVVSWITTTPFAVAGD